MKGRGCPITVPRGTTKLVAILLASLAFACGGSEVQPVSPKVPTVPDNPYDIASQVAPPSAEVASLTFVFAPDAEKTDGPTGDATTEAFRGMLASSRYKLVEQRDVHDVELVTRVSVKTEILMLDGIEKRELVHFTAAVVANGQVVDEVATDFTLKRRAVKAHDVLPAVNALGGSTKIAQFVKQRRDEADRDLANIRRTREEGKKFAAEEAKNQRIAEETEWNQARVTGCRQPSSLAGCDAVRTYVAKYPDGAHVLEAQAALKVSEPLMDKLQKDENNWKTAGVEACRTEHTRRACVGVELYVTKFPAGMHIDDAQALIRRLR